MQKLLLWYSFLKSSPKDMFMDLRERGRERQTDKARETSMWEWNIDLLPYSHTCPNWDGTCNLGMCPDQGWNPQPFGVWDDAPTNCTTWPGLLCYCNGDNFFPHFVYIYYLLLFHLIKFVSSPPFVYFIYIYTYKMNGYVYILFCTLSCVLILSSFILLLQLL